MRWLRIADCTQYSYFGAQHREILPRGYVVYVNCVSVEYVASFTVYYNPELAQVHIQMQPQTLEFSPWTSVSWHVLVVHLVRR